MTDTFTGYMCLTDWQHDVRGASDGARVYPSEAAVRRERKCTAECGIVEVEMRQVRIVQEPDFKKYRLEDLVADMNEENRHEEIDLGAPVGREFGSDEEGF
jgi:hypothetical protein